ncbi:CmpA/NrtA family ABC transporter substrate-binding protein [Alteromonas flava]|uniref:CmpA/NrtA family ABC transporter substrate-binding protein n=1 Tax=Alteromonas flava TaxID=2048003 RepID=UPI000C28E079|nr:CmpA/NrtA family ABC transporter substrate-binding protein [Alteromonas flava]
MGITNNIEKSQLNIGFMPLTDCAPFVVGIEKGFFAHWGLDVSLRKQNSWVAMRDKLQSGQLDAGHMLAPMPMACTLGLGGQKVAMLAPMVLSRNGNAITISSKLRQEILAINQIEQIPLPMPSSLLLNIIDVRALKGEKLRLATVYPYSCHYYQLLSWLAQGGVASDSVDILIIPPLHMVEALSRGDIDAFCVGGPWNAQAVREQDGFTGVTSSDIWPDFPEKVLAITQEWYASNTATTRALICALQQSCDWLRDVPNRFEAARWLASKAYLDTEIDIVAPSLIGSCLTHSDAEPRDIPSYNQFSGDNSNQSNCPNFTFGEWLHSQMYAAGHLEGNICADKLITEVFRPDIYKAAFE